jgi:lipase (class 3)
MADVLDEARVNDLRELLPGAYYGMVWLGLANAAYTSEWKHDAAIMTEDLKCAIQDPNYMPLLPEPGNAGKKGAPALGGSWSLDWGPAIASDWSNLIYLASYRSGPDQTGAPLFYVVGIRGTDTSTGIHGLLDQVDQDLRSFSTHPWSDYLNNGVKIGWIEKEKVGPPPNVGAGKAAIAGDVATGTIQGFDKIAGLSARFHRDGDLNKPDCPVAAALKYLLGDAKVPIVVTGHSLGGCQTQVMTSYLAWQFPDQKVIGHPFAPSTAGDANFAKQAAFSTGCFWWNSLDFVPCGYGPLSDYLPGAEDGYKFKLAIAWAIRNFWSQYNWPDTNPAEAGPPLPAKDMLEVALDIGGGDVEALDFERPVLGGMANMKLNGKLPSFETMRAFLIAQGQKNPDLKSSLNQLLWQHFPPNYQLLLWDDYSSEMVYFNYRTYDTRKHHL